MAAIFRKSISQVSPKELTREEKDAEADDALRAMGYNPVSQLNSKNKRKVSR